MDEYKVRKEMRHCLEKKECNRENIKNYIRFMRDEYRQTHDDVVKAGLWNNNILLGMSRVSAFWVFYALGLYWFSVHITEVLVTYSAIGFMISSILATWPNKMKRSATKFLKEEEKRKDLIRMKEYETEAQIQAKKYKEELEKKYCSQEPQN